MKIRVGIAFIVTLLLFVSCQTENALKNSKGDTIESTIATESNDTIEDTTSQTSESNSFVTIEDVKEGIANIENTLSEELNYVELSNIISNEPITQVEIEDNFMNFEIIDISRSRIFVENKWVDYVSIVKLKGELVLNGKLGSGGGHTMFYIDPNDYFKVPLLISDNPRLLNANIFLATNYDVDEALLSYYGKNDTTRTQFYDVEVTYDEIILVYTLPNFPGGPGGNIIQIKDSYTGDIVYSAEM